MVGALRIYAGPRARRHIEQHGLRPEDIGVVPGAAGGPKGLILGPLDRFLFGHWLPRSPQPVDLIGASIGAWRMATACLPDAEAKLAQLEHDYIRQHHVTPPGAKRPSAQVISAAFGDGLRSFYQGRVPELLNHPRFRLHVVTSRGRHLLRREGRWTTPLGYLGAYASNAVHRRALGAWLERVVFSSAAHPLPFDTRDLRTRQVALTPANFFDAVQASCSIPFLLQAVHDIPGAPPGAYWDGGITDYHLHLDYAGASPDRLVLYPHFQKAVVPGWLDKALRWRHPATPFLDNVVVLAPDPAWVKARLPGAKLPDRTDFMSFGNDLAGRVAVWTRAVQESQALADEWQTWLDRPDLSRVDAL